MFQFFYTLSAEISCDVFAMNRWNVVALGARDYYQVAQALDEAGCLGYLVTDFYTPDVFRSVIKKRFNVELASKKAISLIPVLLAIKILLIALGYSERRRERIIDFVFGFLASLLTTLGRKNAVVYSYYIEGFSAFRRIFGVERGRVIVFQVHPAPWFVKRILEADALRMKQDFGLVFADEIEAIYDCAAMFRYKSSLASADKIICASSFTAESITDEAICRSKIDIIPYGNKLVSEPRYSLPKNPLVTSKIRLLSVCQLVHRKGMHHAFLAMKGMEEYFEWVVVANVVDPSIAELAPSCVNFQTNLDDESLAALYRDSDLFVMPSLVEGFGMVYVEALHFGLPVLGTSNTGLPDLLDESAVGLLVESGSRSDLEEVFRALVDGSIIVPSKQLCCDTADRFTWSVFREKVSRSVCSYEGQQ